MTSIRVESRILALEAGLNKDGLVYAGTEDGCVLGFRPPFAGFCFRVGLMREGVARMAISKCEGLLVVGGMAGLLFVLAAED